ncbi:MAG: alpha/beta fold hydrolase [Bellilinea sp.]
MNATESNDAQILLLDNWIVRVRPPLAQGNNRVFLMLHGLTGDENSMTVFTRNLPRDAWIFSPRAPNPADESGFKWIISKNGMSASFAEFQQATFHLHEAFVGWMKTFHINAQAVDVIGFSQGAVISASYALLYPQEVNRTAFLSGFLPIDTPDFILSGQLKSKQVFVAHGSQDKTVPLAKAQQTVAWLEQWGAEVTYCEAAVGHRLSAQCFKSFADFFKNSE